MPTVEYCASDDMPEDLPVVIVDNGDRVAISLNRGLGLDALCAALTSSVNHYIQGKWVHVPTSTRP